MNYGNKIILHLRYTKYTGERWRKWKLTLLIWETKKSFFLLPHIPSLYFLHFSPHKPSCTLYSYPPTYKENNQRCSSKSLWVSGSISVPGTIIAHGLSSISRFILKLRRIDLLRNKGVFNKDARIWSKKFQAIQYTEVYSFT